MKSVKQFPSLEIQDGLIKKHFPMAAKLSVECGLLLRGSHLCVCLHGVNEEHRKNRKKSQVLRESKEYNLVNLHRLKTDIRITGAAKYWYERGTVSPVHWKGSILASPTKSKQFRIIFLCMLVRSQKGKMRC